MITLTPMESLHIERTLEDIIEYINQAPQDIYIAEEDVLSSLEILKAVNQKAEEESSSYEIEEG